MPASDPLARVKRAARRKSAAETEYSAALVAAAEAGHSFAAIAAKAETSRQNVRQVIGRAASVQPCAHPPARLHSWTATDGTICVGCSDCGAALAGAA